MNQITATSLRTIRTDRNRPFGTPSAAPNMFKEIPEMLLYEELARARIRDVEEAVRGHRTPPSRRSSRRWFRTIRGRIRSHRS
ncbi:hypothetical protein [Amycolatopsis cihanbeyliensis]|uniref:Uncharacterized protein n=1 Tax=Amycolatopsis cihanbeyliensis TaxID=1128664 RepID=A0A542DPG7_AMYCI|nr:hypothetical protein [Amycolatopsis cihanbeyliensis]TQJ04992.1 hypothetical protein FB471_4808 [Amycolatopsis cihanbeyliensis]